MNAWWAAALAGAVCGLLSGLGIGGGTLLMVWMTGVAALPQQTAQGINLLYFLPVGCLRAVLSYSQQADPLGYRAPGRIGRLRDGGDRRMDRPRGWTSRCCAACSAASCCSPACASCFSVSSATRTPDSPRGSARRRRRRRYFCAFSRDNCSRSGSGVPQQSSAVRPRARPPCRRQPGSCPAISRYSAARGPSVPSILRGNPITSRSAPLSCTSAAMASAVCCGRRLWMTVVPADDAAARIGNGDPRPGVAVVNGKNSHGASVVFYFTNTAQLQLQPTPDIFRRSIGLKRLRYTKYICAFQVLSRQKIFRSSLAELCGAFLSL